MRCLLSHVKRRGWYCGAGHVDDALGPCAVIRGKGAEMVRPSLKRLVFVR